jgi:hypothetical protein
MLIVLVTWEAESGGLKLYTSLGRNFGWQDSLNGKKLGIKHTLVIPAMAGSLKQEDCGSCMPGHKQDSTSKITRKKYWRHGSSYIMPT